MFLQYVKCLRYGTLRYVTWGWKTRIRRATTYSRLRNRTNCYKSL